MLYEARRWYFHVGNPALVSVVMAKNGDVDELRSRIRALKKVYPLDGVDEFEEYRNKVGYHYDKKFVYHLRKFSESDASQFNDILRSYVKFSEKWVELCREVLERNFDMTNGK